MGLFERFPYTNFHGLNLDWLLAEVKQLREDVDDLTEKVTDLRTRMDTAEENIDDLLERMTEAENAITTLETSVGNLVDAVSAMSDDIDALEAATTVTDITSEFIAGATVYNMTVLGGRTQVFKCGNRIFGNVMFTWDDLTKGITFAPPSQYMASQGAWAALEDLSDPDLSVFYNWMFSNGLTGFYAPFSYAPALTGEYRDLAFSYDVQPLS